MTQVEDGFQTLRAKTLKDHDQIQVNAQTQTCVGVALSFNKTKFYT